MDEDKWLLKDIRWSVRPIHLPDSEEYLYDLENISMATVGVLGKLEPGFESGSLARRYLAILPDLAGLYGINHVPLDGLSSYN